MVDEHIQINALHGHKTELKQNINNSITVDGGSIQVTEENLPRWIQAIGNKNKIIHAVQRAKESRSGIGIAAFDLNFDQNTHKLPSDIVSKINTYLEREFESHKEHLIPPKQGFRHSFYFVIELGPRGGVSDIYIESHFKN